MTLVRHKNKSFSQGRAARLLFFILVVVNGALVLVVVPIAHAWFSHLYRIELFPAGYDLLASNLLDGRGLRYSSDTALTMTRTPAYPLMLAGLFALFGKSLTAAKLLNVVLTALAAGLLTRVTGRLTTNHLAPMAAAALLLLSPPVVLAESRAGVEIPLMFCIVLFIERLQHAWNEDRTRDWIVAGIVLGLAALVRSTPLLFAVILLPIMWVAMYRNTSVRRIISRWGLLVVGLALVLSPWLARNYSLVGEWVPLMTRSGLSAHTGLYRCKHLSLETGANSLIHDAAGERRAIAGSLGILITMQRDARFYSASDELRFSRHMWGMVQDEYRRQPSLLPRCAALNLVGFFIGGKNWIATLLNAFVQIPYLLIACLGVRVAAARRAGPGLWLVVAFAVYYVGIHLPFLAIARYSVPLTPLLCAPAGIALAVWLDRGARR